MIYNFYKEAKIFHKIIEELKDIVLTVDKLEFIRAVVLSSDVDKI